MSNENGKVEFKLTPRQMKALAPLTVAVDKAKRSSRYPDDHRGAVLGQPFVATSDPRRGEAEFYFFDYKAAAIVRRAVLRALKDMRKRQLA